MSKIALVGCAHIHTPGFVKRLQKRLDITVKYVWDHDFSRAEKYARQLNGLIVSDLSTIWEDEQIRAVVICSETNWHEQLVLPAVAAQKHLFVEKPLGIGAADAYRMANVIEKAGVLFQTGYFMRGQPIHLFLREQIQQGNFGTITRIRHSNCHSGSLEGWFDSEWRWMAEPEVAGCGAFGDLGTHSLDILMWLMGEVTRVTADIGVATARYGACDEYGEGLLHFANGTVGTLAAGWVDVANPVTIIVSGTEGHAHVVEGKLYYKSQHLAGADGQNPHRDLPAMQPHAFDLFLDAITGMPNVPLVTASEAAARNAVMEALYKAASEQTWVVPHAPRAEQ